MRASLISMSASRTDLAGSRTRVGATVAALALVGAGLASGISPATAAQVDGLIAVKSPRSAAETLTRLEAVLEEKGLKRFARIDHAAGAASVGKTLRPTVVLIFGNPQGGTPFIECAQSVGIDLPLKALVWEDNASQAWVGYNDPAWIANRHGVKDCPAVGNLSKALAGIAAAAVAK